MWTEFAPTASSRKCRLFSLSHFRKGLLVVLAMVCICVNAAGCEDHPWEKCTALRDAAGEIPWTTENMGKLRSLFSTAETVNQFICTFRAEEADGVAYSIPFSGQAPEDNDDRYFSYSYVTSDYTFLNLHGDDRLELVGVDNNGGSGADSLILVEQVGGKFFFFGVPNETEIASIEDCLYKPKGAPDFRILGKEILEWPENWAHADPLPVLVHVYEWNGQDWVLADTKHKDYYAKVVLPPLEAKLAQGPCPDEDAALQAKCRYSLEKEIATVKAILAAP